LVLPIIAYTLSSTKFRVRRKKIIEVNENENRKMGKNQ
jgi:hypothetical protein